MTGIIRTTLLIIALAIPVMAQMPRLLDYQGRIAVNGVNFDGDGWFKFALVDAEGTTTFWSNDGTSVGGSEPTSHITLSVVKGLYSVRLGEIAVVNMSPFNPEVFDQAEIYLRVWFNDGVTGFQQLMPDRRIAAVAYALMAESV